MLYFDYYLKKICGKLGDLPEEKNNVFKILSSLSSVTLVLGILNLCVKRLFVFVYPCSSYLNQVLKEKTNSCI